ncbi:post-transcriptional regulator [Paenibacillus doosanensis]|uniref:post-transcriptional regulator n=1 Tax=Paenibacillus doosanensis TaxID=1229154 RepID=UPI00287B8C7C|nr:post-transcriptional regulator [Paenibacillus doosanensis]
MDHEERNTQRDGDAEASDSMSEASAEKEQAAGAAEPTGTGAEAEPGSGEEGDSLKEAAVSLEDPAVLAVEEASEFESRFETALDAAPGHEPEAEIEMLSDDELNEVIESICTSKAEEFRMIGYEHVTGKDIWECVSDKYRKTGSPPLHRVVNDILSLKVTSFMNWMTMSIYKTNPFQ